MPIADRRSVPLTDCRLWSLGGSRGSRIQGQSNVCFSAIAFCTSLGYFSYMVDLKLEVPVAEEVEVDAKTLAAIDRGAADADAGRVVPLEEVRKLIPHWISKFASPKPR